MLYRCKKCSDISEVTSGDRAEIENVKIDRPSDWHAHLPQQMLLLKCHRTFYIYGPLDRKAFCRNLERCFISWIIIPFVCTHWPNNQRVIWSVPDNKIFKKISFAKMTQTRKNAIKFFWCTDHITPVILVQKGYGAQKVSEITLPLPRLVQYVPKNTDLPCIKGQWPCFIYLQAWTSRSCKFLPHT